MEGPKQCKGQEGYNDKSGCALKKLLQALVKLQERVKEEQGRMYWERERTQGNYRDALSKYSLSLRKGTKSQDLDHLTSEILLSVADALSIVFDAKQAAGSTAWAKLAEAGEGTIAEEAIGKFLEVAATPLDLGPYEEELGKLLGSKAGTGELNEVYGAASDLAYKRENPKAAGKVTSFGLGFLISFVRAREDAKYELAVRTIENKIALEAHTLDVTARNLLLHKDFGRFLNDQNNEVGKMIAQVEGTLEKSQTHHSEAKRKQCLENYEQTTQTLNQNYETEKQNLVQSLDPFQQVREAANLALEKHERDCRLQEYETDGALQEMRSNCAMDVGQSYCDKAMARFDQAMHVYEKDLQCLGSKTGQDLLEAQRQLTNQRQIVENQIKTLEQNLQKGLAQAAQAKDSCLQAKELECDVTLPVATSDQFLQTLFASLDDSLAALSPLGIKCGKDSFDCASFGFNACTSYHYNSGLHQPHLQNAQYDLCRLYLIPPGGTKENYCHPSFFGDFYGGYEITLHRNSSETAKYFSDLSQPLKPKDARAIGEKGWTSCGVMTLLDEVLVNGVISYRYNLWRFNRNDVSKRCDGSPNHYYVAAPYFKYVAALGNCVIRVGTDKYVPPESEQLTEAATRAAMSAYAASMQTVGATIANNPELATFCQTD